MTFIVDDLLVRPFMSLLEVFQSMAIKEMYDVEEIRNDIKENRLLFEIGERERAEYERRRADLEHELEVAEEARERLSGRVEVMR